MLWDCSATLIDRIMVLSENKYMTTHSEHPPPKQGHGELILSLAQRLGCPAELVKCLRYYNFSWKAPEGK